MTVPAVAQPAARVSWADRSRARLGSLFDRLALRGMCLAFDAAITVDDADVAAVRASAAPYLTDALAADPAHWFHRDDERPPPPRTVYRRRIADGVVVGRELASDYVPFHRDPRVPACPENDWIPIQHWVHDGGAPATLIALHGFTMGDVRTDAAVLMADAWYRLGLDVVLLTLPFHGPRAPRDARFSGQLFGSWHVGRLNEAVRQSIHDVRRVIGWLRGRGTAVGVMGVSLGGYLTALLAELTDALAFAIPIAPPVHLGTLPTILFARSRWAKRMPPPLTADQMTAAYRLHCPLTYPLALPRERVLIIAGRGDRIVPPEQPAALWRHWDEPPIYWYSGSHVAPFQRRTLLAAGVAHVRRLGILPSDHAANAA